MKHLYPPLKRSWKGLLAFAVLGLGVLIWQFSVSDHLVFQQAESGFAVATKAGTIHLQDGQIEHGDWAMAFAEKTSPQSLPDGGVLYEDVQDGVDVHWYDKGEKLAGYDVIIEPGIDPAGVRIALDGEEEAFLKNDQLVLPQSDGTAIVHSKPVSYQEIEGEKVPVFSSFKLEDGALAFEVGAYNLDYALVIDPTVKLKAALSSSGSFFPADTELSINTSLTQGGTAITESNICEPFTYTLDYGVVSLEEAAENATITVPLNGAEVVDIPNNSDISNFTVTGTSPNDVLTIFFNNPLAAGSSGAIDAQFQFPCGFTCDGTMADLEATFSADNAPSVTDGVSTITAIAATPDASWLFNPSTSEFDPLTGDWTFDALWNEASGTPANAYGVTDITYTFDLPAGATLVNCGTDRCGTPGSSPLVCNQVGNQIIWAPQNNDALTLGDWDFCGPENFVINFPPAQFPAGTDITLTIKADATLGDGCDVISSTRTVSRTIPAVTYGVDCNNANGTYIGGQGSESIAPIVGTSSNRASSVSRNSSNVNVFDYTVDVSITENWTDIYGIYFRNLGYLPGQMVEFFYQTNVNPTWTSFVTYDVSPSGFVYTNPPINNVASADIDLPPLPAGEYYTMVRAVVDEQVGNGSMQFGPNFEVLATGRDGMAPSPQSYEDYAASSCYQSTTNNCPCPAGVTCLRMDFTITAFETPGGNQIGPTLCDRERPMVEFVQLAEAEQKYIVGGTGNVNVGDTVTYQIEFRMKEFGNQSVMDLILTDTLPEGFIYVPGTMDLSISGSGVPDPQFSSVGNTILVWDWSANPAPDNIYPTGFDSNANGGDRIFRVQFDVAITFDADPGTATNCFSLAESPINSSTALQGNECHDAVVNSTANLTTIKWVKGSLDSEYSRFPDFGLTEQGADGVWRFVVTNNGNIPLEDIKIFEIFPFVGDQAVAADFPRLTEWEPIITSDIFFLDNSNADPANLNLDVIPTPAGVTVQYSTESNPCRAGDLSFSPPYESMSCVPPNWQPSPPANLADLNAFLMNIGGPLMPGDTLVFAVEFDSPVSAQRGEITWNSFAQQATRTDNMSLLPVAEPNKVGVTVCDEITFDTPTTLAGTCDISMMPNDDARITITGITGADVVGISIAGSTSYDGSMYDATAAANDLMEVIGGSVTFTNLEHDQSYVIRFFNMDDICVQDLTVTTATVNCNCDLTISNLTTSNCVNGLYTLTGNVIYTTGTGMVTLTVSDGGNTQQVTVNPSVNGGAFSVTDLICDVETNVSVSAAAINEPSCTASAMYDEPTCDLDINVTSSDCHGNGTPEESSDDYFTFLVTIMDGLPAATHTFTATATQGGTPITIQLANGSPANALECGIPTPLRTPAGTAGQGDIMVTITNNTNGCTQTINITDPGSCAVTCIPPATQMVMYSYHTPVQITELVDVPIILPQFDDQNGTRILTSATLEYGTGAYFSILLENSAAQPQTFSVTANATSIISLNSNSIANNSLSATSGFVTLPAGIAVPPQGTWPGDMGNSTIGEMRPWASDLMSNFKDPRLDPRWVATATGDPTTDDDLYYLPITKDEETGMVTYTTPGDLLPFIGSGNVPLEVSTLSGITFTGGGGNLGNIQRTRGYAFAKVKYTYQCIECPELTMLAASTPVVCTGNTVDLTITHDADPGDLAIYSSTADDLTAAELYDFANHGANGITQEGANITPASAAATSTAVNGITPALGATTYYVILADGNSNIMDPDCLPFAQVTVTAGSQPTVGTYEGDLTICETSTDVIDLFSRLDGETSGGTWTEVTSPANPSGGTFDAVAGTFDPDGASAGTYQFNYAFAAAGGCTAVDATVSIIVEDQAEAGSQAMALTICETSMDIVNLRDQLDGEDAGGTWTAAAGNPVDATNPLTINTDNASFDPANAQVGAYVFTYSFAATTVCAADMATVIINVTAQPTVGTYEGDLSICESSTDVIDLFSRLDGESAGGTWTAAAGNPVDSPSPFDGTDMFDPANAQVGTYTFTYTIPAGGGCEEVDQAIVIEVVEQPEIGSQTAPAEICQIDDTEFTLIDLLDQGTTSPGGAWTAAASNPGTAGFNMAAGTFDADGVAAGTYLFTYTIDLPDGNPCEDVMADVTIIVNGVDYGDLPDASIAGTTNYATRLGDTGPRHCVPATPDLVIGATVDTEADGQPDADPNTAGDGADEDGFDPSATMFVAGQTTNVMINIVNTTGSGATLVAYADWNNNGTLDDAGEVFTVAVPATGGTVTVPFAVPTTAILNVDLGVRFRLSTDAAAAGSPTGDAPDGEVEDYFIQVMGFDYGDLPDAGPGVAEDNYETQSGSSGPSHKISTDENGMVDLKIGASVDAEVDGQQSAAATGDGADEDGFDPSSLMFITGIPTTFDVPVMNMTGMDAKLTIYIDWNNNGDLTEAGEMYSTTISSGAGSQDASFSITPPLTANVNEPIGVRLRLTTDTDMSPNGPASDGEVEDYLISPMAFDYGDLNDVAMGTGGDETTPTTPADYATLSANDGARHKIVTDDDANVTLKIGATVDDEANGQPSADAGETGGDDNSESDDEDGLDANNLPLFILTQTTTLDIPVMNMTGMDATIAVYIDFNKDGTLDPATEKFTATVANNATTVAVDIDVPVDAVVGQDLGMRIRLASDMAEVMTATGTAQSGEVEDYMVQVVGFDYGDLPDTYTTSDPEAPKHIVDEDLLLGTCVDTEVDGNPEAMAGLMQGGDDADPGLATFGTCGTAGDDEDGIEFVTPMISGEEACIEVTAVNNKGADATLQMWVDWNGDGSFNAGEEVTFTSANGNTIPDGGVNAELYCFDVPADAAFREGAAFVRFRLSEDGGLAPDSQTGVIPFGEIEDYKLPLGKIGNLVFEDYDFDGEQDAGEPGIDGVTVGLIWLGPDNTLGTADDVVYADLTTGSGTFDQGEYYFCGLIEGDYKLTYTSPTDLTPTRTDQGGDDELDSDGVITGMDLSMVMETFTIEDVTDLPQGEGGNGDEGGMVGTFPDEQTDETHDQGFACLDYGDLPQDDTPDSNDDFSTTMIDGGAVHVVIPGLSLGETVECDLDGTPTNDASGDGAEEDGVSFTSPLIPGNEACITVDAINTTGSDAVLQAWIDWDNSGTLDADEELTFTNGGTVADGGVVDGQFCFDVPADAEFNDGMVFARFRLSPTGGLDANGPDKFDNTSVVPQGEVEDYKANVAKIGNLVFEDFNFDGLQEDGEPGLNGIEVTLVWGGTDGTVDGNGDITYATYVTGDDPALSDGEYYFCGLVEGEYKLVYNTDPADMLTPTRPNVMGNGEDQTDSDGLVDMANLGMVMETFTIEDVTNLPTGEQGLDDDANDDDGIVGTFPDNQTDETHDQGFARIDYGDLPEDGNGDDFSTTMAEDGAVHVIFPGLTLGTTVDAEQDGQPSAEADGDGADEDGIVFATPLIPGNEACVNVTARVPSGSTAVLQGWIDWDNSGTLDAGEELTFLAGNSIGTDIDEVPFCFEVPEDALFNDGMVFARFRLSENGGLQANGPDKYDEAGAPELPIGEVEDHKDVLYKVGNYIWEDLNRDGLQDDFSSPCFDDVEMQMVWAGPDGDLATTDDNIIYTVTTAEANDVNGIYTFCGLIPGTYEISVPEAPAGMVPTQIGAGNNPNFDSNDPAGTAFVIEEGDVLPLNEDGNGDNPGGNGTFPDGQDNLSFDFGFVTDGYEVICNCDGSITLDWEPFSTGDTWTVDVEDENGNPVVDFVNMSSTEVTFVPGTLTNGECYYFAITENLGNAEVEAIIGVIHANCNPIPELELTGVGPTCPGSTDGSITVTLTEQGCNATYDVFLIEAGVGEQQIGDDVSLNTPFLAENLGEGTYSVRLELVDRGDCAYGDGCLPVVYDEVLTLENTDDEAPTKTVTDESGNEPEMTIVYESIPEGECGVQFDWFVELDDNCPVSGLSLSAAITTDAANPSVDPSASVTLSGNGPVYVVSVHAGIGTNTLVLTATDESGNINEMVYEITVVDNRPPEIYGPGDMQVQIPACEDGMPVNWQMSVIDDCDLDVELVQISGPQPGDVLAPGVYTVVYEATDDYGNTSQYSFDITVTQAPSPAPIVDVSGNGQFVIEDCAEDGFIVFSGHIYDCELQPGDVLDGLISIIGAPLEITYILVNEGYAYFEATGNLSAGSYLIVASYEGITVDHGVEVVQDADTPAVMTMPGNLTYQVPNCEGEAAVSFAVQLEDDCDEDFGTASFTVNGAPAPPFDAALSDPANGYFAWSLSLSPGVYTIVGTYTDGGGNTTEATATITVNADEDNSAPIIVYPSQNITEVLDPCGPDEAEICFQATAIDDCEGDIVPTVTVTGPGGVAVPVTADGTTYCFTAGPGQYTVSIGAADAAGNSTSEAFGVSVTQDDAPEANLACNDDINVTLDENCSRVITADMVLEGNFGCLQEDDFTITIVNDDNPANGNILDGHGQWIYEITGPDVAGFEPCWGFITGEDKTAPVIECPDDTDVATVTASVQQFSGELTTADPQINLSDYSCFLDYLFNIFGPVTTPLASPQYYDLIEFQVSEEDVYTIYLTAPAGWNGGAATAVFQGGFNPDSPCENILTASSADLNSANLGPIGGGINPTIRMTLPLRPYETYTVLVSSVDAEQVGPYTHTIFSDGNGLVGAWNFTQTTLPDWTTQFDTTFSALPSTTEDLVLPLFCNDFDQIYGGDAGSVAQETAFISGTYQWVGAPSATDNCDNNVDITATDSFTASGDCGDVVITRSFTATDDKGLTDECQQQITFRKPTLADVTNPPITVVVECDEDFPTLANGNPAPELTGYPFIFTAFGIFDIAPSYCNIGASFDDLPTVDECEGRFKFRREWTVFDWCDPGSTVIIDQLIKVGDYTAPTVTCPAGTPLSYSTSPFSCGASFEVPMPTVSDNCSNVTVYTEIVTTTEEEVINQYGLPTGQFVIDTVVVRTIQPGANRFVASIPFGDHFFRYVAEDDCGNETELYCPFSVIDQIEPVAVCDDQLNVSIGGGNIVPGQPALARVFASDVDEGSWDNCGDVSIAIFRDNFDPINYTCGTQNSVTGDFVDFFCCDVGVTSDITLVVTDQYGNQNSCWLSVTPEDKINPFCDAPDNVVVDCDDLPYGFDASDADQLEDLFGMATGADNCGVADVQQVAANADLECGYGSITRIFRVTDVNGLSSTNSCVQVITVNEVHNYEIYFPEDAEANCGTPTPDTVEYNELGCDLLAVTSSDEQFSASGDECYKIFRTWKVINWCQYDGESDPYIVGRDEDCNGTPGDGDRIANNGNGFWLLARPNGKIYFDQDTDETPDNNVPGINFCGTSNDYYDFDYDETGYYQYTQIIKVYDDEAPEISFTQADAFCSLDNVNCDANVTYPFSIDEDCTPDDLTIKVFLDPFLSGDLVELDGVVSGSYPDYTITVNDLPIGSHAFEVHVLDGCGNSDLAILPFDIIDCKAPAPFCINGIAIELMPVDEDGDNLPDPGAGMAEIWASDFVDFSTQAGDCSEPIKYSINRVGEPNNPDQTGLVLTCDDEGTLVIEIWAYDAAGNSDFCETYILVQDNMGVCGAAAPMAAGAVNTEDNEPVEDVEVSLSGQASTAMMTQNDGAYVFTDLTAGLDYTITPQRDGDYLNGVSTFDLVLISKHILGLEALNSPYKRIAADANNSGSITTLDLIQLRKLILSVSTELPSNTSWRFVEASYVFPNPADPWQEAFPEVVNINDLPATGIHGADFIAVKIGDVSGDVVANSFSSIDERGFDGRFQLETADEALKSGNEYRIPFTAPELAAIEGFQGTLEFDAQALELVEILPGTLSAGHFGLTQAEQGRVAMSWNWASETAVPTDSELFTLVLRARTDVQLSGALGMSDAVTRREAYGKAGTLEDVALHFGEAAEEAGLFVLYQNQPNPFREETVIGFELPEAVPATVTISDVAGRVVRTYPVDGVKGYNQIIVKMSDLGTTGVLSYTVSTDDHTATKKMVVLK